MGIKVYNTLTKQKEDFIPLHGRHVNFYVCGPTVYDYFHIGNARPLIMFDVFRRYLEYRGYTVNYIVNITDIDDKIIKRANQENVPFKDITRLYSEAFFEGCRRLGVKSATVHPYATDHIVEMIDLIQRLIAQGHAYVVDGDVYYDISTFPGYGKLSGRDIEQLQAGARVEVDERKRNPLDFALWKASKSGEPSWKSPWGDGRPGWHIECSVMAMCYAGDTLDIHAGGQDLIFPHHENEIAQSEGATGKPFSKYWLHNGFLDIEGEKMSKSLGNFLTVKNILNKYNPMAIRVFFLLKHYRSPINFSEARIREAQAALNRLRNTYRKILHTLEQLNANPSESGSKGEILSTILENKGFIIEALDDDFNTARAMGNLFEIARIVNSSSGSSPDTLDAFKAAKEVFDSIGSEVFGLTFETEQHTEGLIDDLMNVLIEIRSHARREKNWVLSDMIRDKLKAIGVVLEDRPDETTWKIE